MKRAESSPAVTSVPVSSPTVSLSYSSNGRRPNTSPATLSGSCSTSPSKLLPTDYSLLPVGVSALVASRMRLDAMSLAPSTLELRMNTQNLLNEMKYNNGRIVSHQFALMKPRKKEVRRRPKGLSEKEKSVSEQVARLQKKVDKKQTKESARTADKKEVAFKEKEKKKQQDQEQVDSKAAKDGGQGVQAGQGRQHRLMSDPNLDIEISRLLDDPRCEEVWRTLQGSGPTEEEILAGATVGLQRNRVTRALQALGHTNPDQEKLEESLALIPGVAALNFNEFISVVAVFNRQRRDELKSHFKRLDEDGSGTISAREFKHFLWDLGFTVTPQAVEEYLNEADDDHSGEIEFPEFEYACQLVHQRHGFSSQEAAEFDALFERYDTDGSHEMESDELASAMGWFGTPITLDQAKLIIAKFDSDDNGTLAKAEFLMVMRERLEEEISHVQSLFAEFDRDCEGALNMTAVLELFMKVGYSLTPAVLEDAMRSGMPSVYKKAREKNDYSLVFEDVLHLFHLIRDREGFSDKEMSELTDIFNRHDKTGKGELREFELARCLQGLGYPLSPQRRRELWCRVDVDKTESIELHEFLKLVRILREEETKWANDAIEQCGKQGLGTHMPEPILKQMLMKLGYFPQQSIIGQAIQQSGDSSGDGNVDLQGLLSILRFIREKQVKKLRENAGVTEQHAAKIRAKFNLRFDAGKAIPLHDFEHVMHELFPVAVHEQIERDKIRALLKQSLKDSKDGIKSLMEAYWIVRVYNDMLDEAKWQLEQDAARDAGFTKWQVASFREAFVAADANADGFLSLSEIQAIFDDLVSLNLTQIDLMRKEFNQLASRKKCITFAEFLKLMHVILFEGS